MTTTRCLPLINPVLAFMTLAVTVNLIFLAANSFPLAKAIYVQTGYFFMLALVGLYAFVLLFTWRDIRAHANSFWAKNWHGAIFAVFLSSLIFISVPRHHRVLYDDLHLLSVAKEMTFEQKAIRHQEVWRQNPDFVPSPKVEKRPLLFPFFISLLHSLLGYRLSNVFIINYLSLCGFLFGLYCFLQRYMGKTWCAAALLLVVAQPIVPLCATSGGFEACNLAFIALAFLTLRYFLDAPSMTRFQLLIFHLLLLANVQYAAALYLIVILGILGLCGYLKKPFFSQPSLVPIAPLFLVPLILQRIILQQMVDPDYPAGTPASAFGLKYLIHNITALPPYLFDPSGVNGGLAGAINIAGTIAILVLIVRFLRNPWAFPKEFSTLMMSLIVPLSIVFFFALLYYDGMGDHPMIARLYLPCVVILSIAPVILAKALMPPGHFRGTIALLLSAALFLFYFPVATSNQTFAARKSVRELHSTRELTAICDFWEQYPLKNNLIIYRASRHFAPFLNDAISFKTAKRWKAKVREQFKQHTYNDIYVIQRILYKTGATFKEDRIDKKIPLMTLAEKRISNDFFLRFSVVKTDPNRKKISKKTNEPKAPSDPEQDNVPNAPHEDQIADERNENVPVEQN